MISASLLSAVSGGVYAVTLVALLARTRRVPQRLYRYCYLILFVVGLGATTEFFTAAGIGAVHIGEQVVELPRFANDAIAYSIMWGIIAMIGGASRRLLAVVVAFPVAQVTAFQFGSTAGGLVGLASSIFVVGGHFVFLYLYWVPIWRTAKELPDQRRLLYWKTRNLLWFLNGMLIVYAFLLLAGAFTMFGMSLIGEYISVLIRVGFAGFLFANIDALVGGDAAGPDVPTAEFGTSAPDAAD